MKNKKEERQEKVLSARKRAEQHEVSGLRSVLRVPDGVSIVQIKEAGTKKIDVIPFTVGKGNPFADEGETYFERTYWSHRGIGPNKESFVCSAKTFKKPCAVCDHRAKLTAKGSDEDLIKDLMPKERQIWLWYDHAERDKGVQVFEYSYHLFGKELDEKVKRSDPEDGLENYADPRKGSTLKVGISKEGGGSQYTYFKCVVDQFLPRGEPVSSKLLKHGLCPDEMLVETSYEKVKKVLLQTGDDEEENEDDTPHRKNGKKRPQDDEEDDKDDSDDESDDEEGDEQEKEDEDQEDDSDGNDDDKESSPKLKVGDMVVYKGEEWEIKKLSKDGEKVTIENDDGDETKLVNASLVKKASKEDSDEDEDEEEVVPKKKLGRPKK